MTLDRSPPSTELKLWCSRFYRMPPSPYGPAHKCLLIQCTKRTAVKMEGKESHAWWIDFNVHLSYYSRDLLPGVWGHGKNMRHGRSTQHAKRFTRHCSSAVAFIISLFEAMQRQKPTHFANLNDFTSCEYLHASSMIQQFSHNPKSTKHAADLQGNHTCRRRQLAQWHHHCGINQTVNTDEEEQGVW